jgi:hypothetical protein
MGALSITWMRPLRNSLMGSLKAAVLALDVAAASVNAKLWPLLLALALALMSELRLQSQSA